MGDAGVMGGAAANAMTLTTDQTVLGAKTFQNQKLVLRNPADTFSLTVRNPAITANKDSWLNSAFSYYIFKDGSTYYAKNGTTQGIDYSNAAADVVLTSIVNGVSAGTPLKIELGDGDFNIASTFSAIIGSRIGNITIKGQGPGITNLVLQTSITGSNKGIDIAGTLGTDKALTANCAKGENKVTVSTTDAAGFAQYDYVLLKSARLWDTSGAASATGLQGEIHKVKSSNTGTGVVTFYDAVFDSYATADTAAIAKITMVQNITLEGFTIKPVSASYTATGTFLRFYMIDNLRLKNVELQDNVGAASSGIRLESVINSDLDVLLTQTGTVPFVALPSTGQYGIWLGCASQQVKINLISKGPFRHAFTSGGIAGSGAAGVARGITVTGIAEGCKSNTFDTHRDTDGITFTGCQVIGQADGTDDTTNRSVGIGVRAENAVITGCNIRGCTGGGIVVNGNETDKVVITGNSIHDCPSYPDTTYGYGIRLQSGAKGTKCVISNNSIYNCGNNAIWGEDNNNDTIISNNTINACKPIKFTDSINCVMVGNRINNGANKALEMTGTSTGWTIEGNDATGSAASTQVGTNIVRNNTNITNSALINETLTTPTISGAKYTDLAKTSNYTLLITDAIIRADASAGAFTLTLPTAVGVAGQEYTIRRTDILASTNLLTIATTSSQTIGGALAEYLIPAEYIKVESDGANWQINARSTPLMYGYYYLKNATNDRKYIAGLASNGALIASTTSPAANTLWATPFIVAKTTKFDTISFSLATAGSANARAGIYRDNGNLYPGSLIFDTGSIDCSTGTIKNTTITAGLQVFPPGIYWAAWECDAATIQVRSLPTAPSGIGILGCGTNMTAANSGYGYSVTHTFGALPDPYTGSASLLTSQPSVSAPVTAIGLRPI